MKERRRIMRIILEVLRFMLVFFIIATLTGLATVIITGPILTNFGLHPDEFVWIGFVIAIPVVYAIYKKKKWGNVMDRKIFWTSIAAIILLLAITPAATTEFLHTSKYAQSYGFPFPFLTLYVENGSQFLLPNLLSGKLTGSALHTGVFINFLLIYFVVFLGFFLKKRVLENRENTIG